MIRTHNRAPGLSATRSVVLLLILSVCAPPAITQEQEQPKQEGQAEVRKLDFKTYDEIQRFVETLLSGQQKYRDPFVRSSREQVTTEGRYVVRQKVRPAAGFGKYDIDTLKLLGIYRDSESTVAMFRAPDGKLFTVKEGEEAYDGKIEKINLESGYVKFIVEMVLEGPQREGVPQVRREERMMRLRR
jgi:Tfp pilus assembly protein PilP